MRHQVRLEAFLGGRRLVERAVKGDTLEIVDANGSTVAILSPAYVPVTRAVIDAMVQNAPAEQRAELAWLEDLAGAPGWGYCPATGTLHKPVHLYATANAEAQADSADDLGRTPRRPAPEEFVPDLNRAAREALAAEQTLRLLAELCMAVDMNVTVEQLRNASELREVLDAAEDWCARRYLGARSFDDVAARIEETRRMNAGENREDTGE